MSNIKEVLLRLKQKIQYLTERLTDDSFRYYFQMCVLTLVVGFASLFMGVLNIITGKTVLMIATLSFALIMGINYAILRIKRANTSLTFFVFETSVLVLFTYFLITGGTEGFSPHWILILPACGMMFLGARRGLAINAIMLVFIVLLLDFRPLLDKLPFFTETLHAYPFTVEFRMRFQIVYICFLILGWVFEQIRLITYRAMVKAQGELASAATVDSLTKLWNRHWFNQQIEIFMKHRSLGESDAALMIDIDNFKRINDTYGHLIGDNTLVAVSNAIRSSIRLTDAACRWGGEEFFIFLKRCDTVGMKRVSNAILEAVRSVQISDDEGAFFAVTVSIGAVLIPYETDMSVRDFVNVADKNLYLAKRSGKDQVVF